MSETVEINGYEVDFIRGYTSAQDMRDMQRRAVRDGILSESELREPAEQWTYGWKVTIGKHQYGDYISMSAPIFEEAKPGLIEQARQVIEAMEKP